MLKKEGYDVTVAHPPLAKAMAYARLKDDKVDTRMLADLRRAQMIPEAYVTDKDVREVRRPGAFPTRVRERTEAPSEQEVSLITGPFRGRRSVFACHHRLTARSLSRRPPVCS